MGADFSYAGYRQLLEILKRGRACRRFSELRDGVPDGGCLILRHDIDMSPEAALRMAEIESDLGMTATYFLLFSAPWYNLLEDAAVQMPRRLVELGHEVGLHYDARLILSACPESPAELLEEQAHLLSRLAGAEVRSISMHNPSTSGEDPFRDTRFINAYDARFAREIAYFSDSCGAWRDEFVARLAADDFPSALQLLIHPVFWGPMHNDRWATLERFMEADADRRRGLADEVRELWSGHAGVREHDRREADTG